MVIHTFFNDPTVAYIKLHSSLKLTYSFAGQLCQKTSHCEIVKEHSSYDIICFSILYVLGSKLPFISVQWDSDQPNSRGLYTYHKDLL